MKNILEFAELQVGRGFSRAMWRTGLAACILRHFLLRSGMLDLGVSAFVVEPSAL
jgi:hypothetical protein